MVAGLPSNDSSRMSAAWPGTYIPLWRASRLGFPAAGAESETKRDRAEAEPLAQAVLDLALHRKVDRRGAIAEEDEARWPHANLRGVVQPQPGPFLRAPCRERLLLQPAIQLGGRDPDPRRRMG